MGHYVFDKVIAAKNERDFKHAGGDIEKYLNIRYFNDNPDDDKNLRNCLTNFFNANHIADLVKQNNWMEIFTCWREDWGNLYSSSKERKAKYYGNKPGWPLYPLVHFLYLAGINFEEYLTEKNIPAVTASDISYSGLVWTED